MIQKMTSLVEGLRSAFQPVGITTAEGNPELPENPGGILLYKVYLVRHSLLQPIPEDGRFINSEPLDRVRLLQVLNPLYRGQYATMIRNVIPHPDGQAGYEHLLLADLTGAEAKEFALAAIDFNQNRDVAGAEYSRIRSRQLEQLTATIVQAAASLRP